MLNLPNNKFYDPRVSLIGSPEGIILVIDTVSQNKLDTIKKYEI